MLSTISHRLWCIIFDVILTFFLSIGCVFSEIMSPNELTRPSNNETQTSGSQFATHLSVGVQYMNHKSQSGLRMIKERNVSFPIDLTVSMTDRLTLNAGIKTSLHQDEYWFLEDSTTESEWSIEDKIVGIKYDLIEEARLPGLSSSLGIILPNAADNSSEYWAIDGSLMAHRTLDPAVVFILLGYQYTFDLGEYNEGNTFLYGYGVLLSLNNQLSLSGQLSGSYTSNSKLNNQTILGSNTEAISANISTHYQINQDHHLSFNVMFGMNADAADVITGLSYGFTL